jgi:hypothetical protein
VSILRMSELATSRVLGTSLSTGAPAAPAPQSVGLSQGSMILAAMSSIVSYIPIEIVTVYVAVSAAISEPASPCRTGQWVSFWVFLALTPITLWALYAARLRASGASLQLDPTRWPWPELIASTVAYALWAFALPGTPFAGLSWYRPGLAGAVLLVGTLVLGLGAPLFARASATSRP